MIKEYKDLSPDKIYHPPTVKESLDPKNERIFSKESPSNLRISKVRSFKVKDSFIKKLNVFIVINGRRVWKSIENAALY